MSKQPEDNSCYSNKCNNSPDQITSQNSNPRSIRNESQNVNYNNTSGIVRVNPYGSNLSSANCYPIHSTPRPPSNFRNQNEYLTSIAQDFTITQNPQGRYNIVNSPRNTDMNTPYMYSPQMQGGPPRQQFNSCCGSAPQGYAPPRSFPPNMSNTGGYYNPPQNRQQYSYNTRQIPDPNVSRKQQVSFQPVNEIKCPHRVYVQYSPDDSLVQFEEPDTLPHTEGEVDETEGQEKSTAEDESEASQLPRTSRAEKRAVCSPTNPCCSAQDIYKFELPRALPTPEQSPCPPSSTCNKHPSAMGSNCPTTNPCFIKKNVNIPQPQASNTPCGKYGSKFVPVKPGASPCCQLGHASELSPKSGEVPRIPCLPTSPCARSYSVTNKSPLEDDIKVKCCQHAYNYTNMSSTPTSSCGQMNNLENGGSCGTSCLSAQSCTSKLNTGRSRIPQRITSSESSGKYRKRLRGKPNREDTKIDSINMLSVVISTVMFLAVELPEIPETYKKWSKTYLKCIKNIQGQSPPNIKKILKMLDDTDDIESDKCKCPYTSTKPEVSKSELVVEEAKEPD